MRTSGTPEVSVVDPCCLAIGSMGGFGGAVCADSSGNAIDADPGVVPTLPLIEADAFQTRHVVALSAPVTLVLMPGCRPEISPAIVREILVRVIDLCGRLLPGDQFPNHSMDKMGMVVDPYAPSGDCPSELPSILRFPNLPRPRIGKVLDGPDQPRKDASVRVIDKALAKELGKRKGCLGHAAIIPEC